jgi:transaldolase
MKIFYDGCSISTYASNPNVVGFTTNTSIMKSSNQLNYRQFYESHKERINGRPISFQIFSDDKDVIRQQARDIHSLGPSIYVKIPIVTSTGESLLPLIYDLRNEGMMVNITAVCTKQQLDDIRLCLSSDCNVPTIVSVFAGRISDTGVNPKEMVAYAVEVHKDLPHVEILWAGVRDNLVFDIAKEIGCHIVTIPDAVISRMHRLGSSFDGLSTEVVGSFLKDGQVLSIL